MAPSSPLWPAQLHHLQLTSDEPERLLSFYRDAVDFTPEKVGTDVWLMKGAQRRVLIARGERGTLGFAAFGVADSDRLHVLERHSGLGRPFHFSQGSDLVGTGPPRPGQ